MFPSKSRIEAKNTEMQRRIQERRRIEREAELAAAPPLPAIQPATGPDLPDESDSDAAPEQESSKTVPSAAPAPAPAPARAGPRVCSVFKTTGMCKFGRKCRYSHPAGVAPKPRPSGRMTLHQRLVEQEVEKNDAAAVLAIRYLGDLGYFRREGT